MPRGRHRFSSPMRGLLPPVSFAAVALGCAAGAWLVSGDGSAVRWLAAGAAGAAVGASALMRLRDRMTALQVTEATGARARAEREHEEKLAELKSDLEEARRVRGELEKRLGSRHGDLARLRTDHAALLARYANAESERAAALEGRRQLAIEAATPVKQLPPARSQSQLPPPSLSSYLRASHALDNLAGNAARQGHGQTHAQAPSGDAAGFSYFSRQPQRAQSRELPPPPSGRRDGGGHRSGPGEPGDAGTDLADVVGPEVLAEAEAETEAGGKAGAEGGSGGVPASAEADAPDDDPHGPVGRVIDLEQAS
ncbi:coiled-coil domain-containing protein [Streptomyces sp. NPDC004134]|uniref:coiled-coil domain-containing protein n=1 Tax=Streptomyces sp. NPDC004134 TaxID=3364691 RepID=UPI00369E9225